MGDVVVNQFTYPVLKLWGYVGQIRGGALRELAPLLTMLVDEPDETTLAEERNLILQEADEQKRVELLAAAIAIGSQYFEKAFLWKFFSEEAEQMKNVSFIEDWIEEGRKEGIEEGKVEMTRDNIEQILLTRFTPSEQELKSVALKLNKVNMLAILQKLHQEALLIESVEAFVVKVDHFLIDNQPTQSE